MKKETLIDLLIPLVLGLLVLGFSIFPFYSSLKWGLYDVFLHLKPAVPEHEMITIVDIDDPTIENLNVYPLTRDLIAQGLINLAEFGTHIVTIDSEFIDKSPRGIREDYLKEDLPREFSITFENLINGSAQLINGLSQGFFSSQEVNEYLNQLIDYSFVLEEELIEKTQSVVRDNDIYLGNAARFFGHSHATITPLPIFAEEEMRNNPERYTSLQSVRDEFDNVGQSHRDLIFNQIALDGVNIIDPHPFQTSDFVSPAIEPVISGMLGAGNVEQHVDDDGVRRRVDILFEWEGRFFPQLGFSGLLDMLEYPEIDIYSDRIVLKESNHPDKGVVDITIPLDPEGRFMINWVPETYLDTFDHVSFIQIFRYNEFFNQLFDDIATIRSYFSDFDDAWTVFPNTAKINWENSLENGMTQRDPGFRQEFRNHRRQFLADAEVFLTLLEENKDNIANYLVGTVEALPPESPDRAFYDQAVDIFVTQDIINIARNKINAINTIIERIEPKLKDHVVVLGYSGKSTTDIGVNPFEKEYMNVGTMANVINTVLVGNFLDTWDTLWSWLFVFPLTFLIPFIFVRLSPTRGFMVGLAMLATVFGIYLGIFIFTGLYLDLAVAILLISLTFITSVIVSFRRTNSQKSFIRDAFGQYLSNDVINDLIDNPDKLKLGGEKRTMTAIFTDVKGFSTISEQMDPEDLVTLLNIYLTGMSDLMMNKSGTIDKYEGDAIIGFFGAPGDLPNHAEMACRTAIAMKQLEVQMNADFIKDGLAPSKLLTRIGLNSGDMVVGNMGTEKMKNYTMMGNNVNLAARLEGVNKQYQTWILISEYTKKDLGPEFFLRSLDRVRVVGVNTPLRLYEVIGLEEYISNTKKQVVEIFHRGLGEFENGHFEKAKATFTEAIKILPWDGPSQVFYKRCVNYIKNPPENFDGVYNLTSK